MQKLGPREIQGVPRRWEKFQGVGRSYKEEKLHGVGTSSKEWEELLIKEFGGVSGSSKESQGVPGLLRRLPGHLRLVSGLLRPLPGLREFFPRLPGPLKGLSKPLTRFPGLFKSLLSLSPGFPEPFECLLTPTRVSRVIQKLGIHGVP